MHDYSHHYTSLVQLNQSSKDSPFSEIKLGYAIFNKVDNLYPKTSPSAMQHKNTEMHSLLLQVVQKDQQAFATLYDKTINLLYGVALRVTQNHDLAEEVINETYMQVWQQADRYNSAESTVKTWLVMICRSRAIDAIRKNRNSSNTQELQDNIADQQSLPLPDLMVAVEQKSKLRSELDKLTTTQQQLLSLSFFRGFTHNELAEILDMPLGTVKTQIRRAILQLKQRMLESEEI